MQARVLCGSNTLIPSRYLPCSINKFFYIIISMSSPPRLFQFPVCALAPMVRVNSLGFREMCADYGADVVFSEEVVGAKLALCKREVVSYPHVDASVIEYACYEPWKNKWKRTVVLSVLSPSIHSSRSHKTSFVLQLGVADPVIAERAVKLVWDSIDGIDVNMGCPKRFSVANGFGAALMSKPAVAGRILRAIHETLESSIRDAVKFKKDEHSVMRNRPSLSFKTRLRSSPTETYKMLIEILDEAGAGLPCGSSGIVQSICLHARYVDQRSETPPHYAEAQEVIRLCRQDSQFDLVDFVLNGSLASRSDALEKAQLYGFQAGMLGRAALRDPTVFHRGGKDNELSKPQYLEMLREMWRYAVLYRSSFNNFKYHLQRLFPEVPELKGEMMRRIQEKTSTFLDFLPILGVENATDSLYQLWKDCNYEIIVLNEQPCSQVDATGNCDEKNRDESKKRRRSLEGNSTRDGLESESR